MIIFSLIKEDIKLTNETNRLLAQLLEILKLMAESGAEIYRIEESAQHVCRSYEMKRVDVYATTSNIILSVEVENGVIKTHARRVGKVTTDIERIDKLNSLVRRMSSERLSADEISREIDKIKNIRSYNTWCVLGFYGLMAATFYFFFGGRDLAEALISLAIGFGVGVISLFCTAIHANNLLSKFVCSFFACTCAFIAYKYGAAHTVDYIIIGNIMAVIPGIGITNALRDLLTGDSVTGTLRIVEVALLAVAIASGYIVTSTLFDDLVLAPGIYPNTTLINAIIEIISAFFSTTCFGILFNMKGKKLWIASAGGCFAWALFLLLGIFIKNEPVRYLIVSMATTALAEVLARVFKTPASTFCMITLVPLVPGGALYYTTTYALGGSFEAFLSKATYTLSLALSLALGVVIIMSLDRYISQVMKNRKENRAFKSH